MNVTRPSPRVLELREGGHQRQLSADPAVEFLHRPKPDRVPHLVQLPPASAKPGAQHLDGPAVGRLAASTGAARALLTHLQMGNDPDETIASCRAVYDGPVEMVWPESEAEI